MYKVVELDETLKDAVLLIFGDASTRILTIEVDAVILFTIAHLNMSFLGILYRVGGEVGEHLGNTPLVERGGESCVGVILDKLYTCLLHTEGQCLTDVIEGWRKVECLGFDGEGLTHAGGFEDIVDQADQHIAVVADDTDELHTFLVGVDHR